MRQHGAKAWEKIMYDSQSADMKAMAEKFVRFKALKTGDVIVVRGQREHYLVEGESVTIVIRCEGCGVYLRRTEKICPDCDVPVPLADRPMPDPRVPAPRVATRPRQPEVRTADAGGRSTTSCPACGERMAANARFCPECGASIRSGPSGAAHTPEVQTIEKTSKRYKRQMLAAGILMTVSCFSVPGAESSIRTWAMVAFIVGLVWFVVARMAAWWDHG